VEDIMKRVKKRRRIIDTKKEEEEAAVELSIRKSYLNKREYLTR
jgi:hypothetical protein